MKRELKITADGSHTFFDVEAGDGYHSIHGAIRESTHVFIGNGLLRCDKRQLTVFEAGFGTGLNALLTLYHRGEREIDYFGIEKYPLATGEYSLLNYPDLLGAEKDAFRLIHECDWGRAEEIAPGFRLTKVHADITGLDISALPPFDLIYYDAFAPACQPELWDEGLFTRICDNSLPGGIFVTYCARGEVRRQLGRAGFTMYRTPGPPGKREILYGIKQP